MSRSQAHLLAVKNASGKRTGKSARKEARAAQRAAAAADRAAAGACCMHFAASRTAQLHEEPPARAIQGVVRCVLQLGRVAGAPWTKQCWRCRRQPPHNQLRNTFSLRIAEPKPDEAMADAPKLRKAKGSRQKKQSSGAAAGAQGAAGRSEAADAEAMQQ